MLAICMQLSAFPFLLADLPIHMSDVKASSPLDLFSMQLSIATKNPRCHLFVKYIHTINLQKIKGTCSICSIPHHTLCSSCAALLPFTAHHIMSFSACNHLFSTHASPKTLTLWHGVPIHQMLTRLLPFEIRNLPYPSRCLISFHRPAPPANTHIFLSLRNPFTIPRNLQNYCHSLIHPNLHTTQPSPSSLLHSIEPSVSAVEFCLQQMNKSFEILCYA